MVVQYYDNGDLACVDGYSFRRDKRTGYYLSSKPINGNKRIRLHIYMWQRTNGNIPKGYAIHHIDSNKNNNELINLEMLTKTEHAKLHGQALTDEQKKKMSERLLKYAVPKATEWHKSESGREWHKQHFENNRNKIFKEKTYICLWCGNEYTSIANGHNKFCSNNCKSAYRRNSGVDNVERECLICGRKFIVNKYSKKETCSRYCSSKLRGDNKN